MEMNKKIAALGLSAGLLAGGAAGAVLGTSGVSGAAPTAVVQDDPTADDPAATDDPAAADEARPEPGQFLAEALAPLVEDGTLTQAQADAVIERLRDAAPERPVHGPGGHHRGPGLEAAAEALGMTTDELRTALREGSTIAEVAGDRGVDVQTVIDAMVGEAKAHLDEKVAAGDLTQAEADERLAEITGRITDRVNSGGPRRDGGGGPPEEGEG